MDKDFCRMNVFFDKIAKNTVKSGPCTSFRPSLTGPAENFKTGLRYFHKVLITVVEVCNESLHN